MEKSGEGFIDRSKVRILLCDNDAKSLLEVFTLLCKCSYQVTSVRSPRQVIDALNAEGRDIDIILSEVDLPMSKGSKMLKYIMRDKEWQRIPVIMMSARDEVSTVVKCLKLGAADYLVKPLRVNELLNLWTHVWRRRRLIGLAEKNMLNYDFELFVSDPSDANTNSTTLFSDDTDDRSQKSFNPDTCGSNHREGETNAASATAPVETPAWASLEGQLDVPGIDDCQTGENSLFTKKSELKIGESSAFFTYVKSSMPESNIKGAASNNGGRPSHLRVEEKLDMASGQVDIDTLGHVNRDSQENHIQGDDHPSSNSVPHCLSVERSYTPSLEFSQGNCKEYSQVHLHPRSEPHHDVSGVHRHPAYPYYVSGVVNQVMMASSAMYENNVPDLHNHVNSTMLPQFNHISQCPPHVPRMTSFSYYPVGICLQPGQMPTPLPLPSHQNPSPADSKGNKVDHREAALRKFRQKRKERCFKKKIRNANRKELAECRPRVRGQFVRKVNGVNVVLNGLPASADDYDDEEEDEDDQATTNTESSPEDDSMCKQ